MGRHFVMLLLTTLLIAGCAGYPAPTKQQMASMPQHYAQFDVVLGWDTRVIDGKTVIEGIAKNVRYEYMYNLEIRVAALDSRGKAHHGGVAFVIPYQLEMDQMAPFSVKLPIAVEPGSKLRFTYQYCGSDAGDSDGGMLHCLKWMQSFEATVPAP